MKTLILGILVIISFSVHGHQSTDVSICADERCNKACIARHWDGGRCKNELCRCGKIGAPEKLLSELAEVVQDEHACEAVQCEKDCGGHCVDENCSCSMPTAVVDNSLWTLLYDLPANFRDTEGNDVTSCTAQTCLAACKAENAFSGFCLKSLCWCTMTSEEAIEKRNVRPVIELQSHVSELVTDRDQCQPSDCRRQCSNDNKIGESACFYGYCWCGNEPQKIHDKQVRKQKFSQDAE